MNNKIQFLLKHSKHWKIAPSTEKNQNKTKTFNIKATKEKPKHKNQPMHKNLI